ncbi:MULTISPECIES: hypothetical protein [unclassified Rhizobium]|uniref:hypothetical protein n=1 Tax=unclassified Rhizobium TaxID=2613769 RepID=UPI001615FED7|nr:MULTISPECIES: hypothetical protein [unclassified Rhizobium]MBB3319108.1 hypothetical protein [Rhizobium sp. BK181]MCS3743685.1 hypothetical protein [Rhizobium sp. BK661]MCS4094760.1 hypothetical protein [Rhizobium sp. BK176]
MLKLVLVASAVLSLSAPVVLADSPWYRIVPVPNAPGCKVLADPSGRPIQQRYESGGARIYAIGGKACPERFPGDNYATISTARSITTDGNFARIITKTRKLVVTRGGTGSNYTFAINKLDVPR